MKVLMISTDENVLVEGSGVRKRMAEYGKLFDELHIIVYSSKKIAKDALSDNTYAYSTKSFSKLLNIWGGYGVAESILQKDRNSKWVITTQDPFLAGALGWLLRTHFKIPWQSQVHTDVFSPFFVKHSVSNRMRVWFAKFLIPRADGIRVMSGRVKDSIVKHYPGDISLQKKIGILPIYLDVEAIRSAPKKFDLHEKYGKDKFIILMPTRISKEKKIERALEAVREISKATNNVLLLIVGKGSEKKNLESRIQKLGIQSNVRMEGWTDDLSSYYKSADLFLLISVYEGGARAPLEALSSGLPVVMTDVAPANENIVDGVNGRVVPVGDAIALTDRLKELVADREKLFQLKRGAMEFKAPISKELYLEIFRKQLADLEF